MTGPKVFSSRAGQRTVTENTGVKRIAGSDLLTQGKIAEWQYYLMDIQSIVVFANDGSDTWIGTFGVPVAGSLAVRDSLYPFEGQRFYVLEQDTAYQWKDGSWTGAVFDGNTLSPTWTYLDTVQSLVRGKRHVLNTDGDFPLPLADDTGNGNGASLEGHAIEFTVARGVTANLVAAGVGEEFINDIGTAQSTMALAQGVPYLAIFNGTKWEVFAVDILDLQAQITALQNEKMDKAANLSDVADTTTARTNLNVFSKPESQEDTDQAIDNINAGDGVIVEGASALGTKVVRADFATPQEAADMVVTNKVLSPNLVQDAVTAATRQSEFNNITGLLPADGESKFLLTANVDRTLVDYPEFTVVFNPDPYVRSEQLTTVTVPAGQITLPNTAGIVTHRVKVNNLGVVSLSNTKPAPSSTTELLLGTIVALNGEVLSDGGVDQILSTPWLASSDYAVRHDPTTISGGQITPSPTLGQLLKAVVYINQESANWNVSELVPHTVTIPPTDPLVFTTIDRNGVFIDTAINHVDGQHLDTGAVVGANKYSIQIAYQATANLVVVLLGQTAYDTYTDAVNAVNIYNPIVPTPLATALEFSRWVVKGNQYPASGFTDLGISTNFSAFTGAAVISGGQAATSADDIISSNTQNTLGSTNLQEQINELSERTDWEFHTGGGTLPTGNVIVTDGLDVTLPALPEAGHRQRVMAIGGFEVNFNVSGGGEVITSEGQPNDTQFRILVVDNGKEFMFVSDGTNWILEGF